MHRRRAFWFSGIQVAVPKAKPMQPSYDGDKLFRGSESRAEERVKFVACRKSQVAQGRAQIAQVSKTETFRDIGKQNSNEERVMMN